APRRKLRRAPAEAGSPGDLCYRLAVFRLEIPPLRERGGDLRLLVEHFVRSSAREVGKTIRGIAPDALRQLEAYSWPGNVRELQNVIESSVIVCESETFTVDPSCLNGEPALDEPKSPSPAVRGTECFDPTSHPEPDSSRIPTLEEIQRDAILRALRSCNWVIGGPQGAAALLGIKRTTLQNRIQKLGLAALRPMVRSTIAAGARENAP